MVLSGVDFAVERGARVLVRGPNGAGKSTLLGALAGTLPLTGGVRTEDERLRLGVFAQDLAQALPQVRAREAQEAEALRTLLEVLLVV